MQFVVCPASGKAQKRSLNEPAHTLHTQGLVVYSAPWLQLTATAEIMGSHLLSAPSAPHVRLSPFLHHCLLLTIIIPLSQRKEQAGAWSD